MAQDLGDCSIPSGQGGMLRGRACAIMAGMSPWDFKTFWERLTGGDAVAEVSQELGGQPAWERLLTRAGYAGQAQGFLVRFGDDLHRALPLRLDRDSRLALAEHLEAHPLVTAARAQAATGYPSGETPRPASQLEMSPEKTAALWPWLSGQGFLRLCRSCFLSGDEELGHAALAHLDQVCAANPPSWDQPGPRLNSWLCGRSIGCGDCVSWGRCTAWTSSF